MSRAPPFPTNSRSGPRVNGSYPSTPSAAPSSYMNGDPYAQPSRTPSVASEIGGPVRPSRSDLRQAPQGFPPPRPGPPSAARNFNRDSIVTTASEPARRQPRLVTEDLVPPRRRAVDDGQVTPRSAVDEAMAALTSAGASRRQRRENTRELDWEREAEREDAERKRREAERAVQQQRDRMREREVQARRANGRRGGGIDAILDEIQGEWEWVTQPDFNPVELALSLLDEQSSAGKDLDSFRRTKRMLERALKGTIEQHSQTFAAALPHHAAVSSSLTATQKQIQEMKTKLIDTSEALGSKRADLVQLWQRGQTLDEMMKILDEIDHLKAVPDALESLISEKKFLQASVVLLRATKLMSKSDMQEIGALSDLRAYLQGQETTLRDILIDELQSHIYLKTFWCDTRWAAYTAGQQMLPVVEFDEDKNPALLSTGPPKPRLTRFLHDLTLKPNDTPHEVAGTHSMSLAALPAKVAAATEESTRNPESDSFTYIEMLLESLAVLGKLGSGLDTISQRLPIEIYSLVEGTIEEISDRTEFSKRLAILASSTTADGGPKPSNVYMYIPTKHRKLGAPVNEGEAAMDNEKAHAADSLRLAALESSAKDADHQVLKDLYWTLYSKLDAVMQSLRVVYEVANRIGSRRDFRDSSGAKPGTLFPFSDLWNPIQTELRGLLLHYLTPDETGVSAGRSALPTLNDVLRDGKLTRDKGRSMFRFVEGDSKAANKNLKTYEDEVTRVLKDSVPGLVGGTTAVSTSSGDTITLAIDERFASAVQHRLIVSADAFHISIVFHPTLAFLTRVGEILPPGHGVMEKVRNASQFLDEFVMKVYLPLLEEKVQGLFLKAIHSPGAFLPDPASHKLSTHPLMKVAIELMSLINSLCAMQQTTPFHRDNYSRLILGIVIQFYQRCSDKFRELVSIIKEGEATDTLRSPSVAGEDQTIAIAARWAQRLEVAACVSALWATPEDAMDKTRRLCRQETRVELNFLTTDTVTREDLVPSRNLKSLGTLYHSLIWFMRRLVDMKSVVEDPMSPSTAVDTAPPETALMTATSPHFPLLPPPLSTDDELKIPLGRAMALRFDALMKTYEQLAEYLVATLRIDTRCRTIHFLDLAMRRGNYRIDKAAGEPDPHIIDLNTDLSICEECATATLPSKERRFVFEGLGTLMEHLLISNARHVRYVNNVGIEKIHRNMLAMQQNLKTITDASQDADFERAKQYYDLYSITPEEMLARIKKHKPQFSPEEYKTMLNFQCNVDQALGERGAAQSTNANYAFHLIELHKLAIEMD